jgi:preprotein translocase subunit SecD
MEKKSRYDGNRYFFLRMRTSFLFTKFALLLILTAFFSLFVLKPEWQEKIPYGIGEKLSEYPLHLGLDLAGGTQIEYEIDFSAARNRVELSKSDNDPSNDLEPIDEVIIAAGVARTLKNRIDPDGTKEIIVLPTKRGEGWHIVVELPKDIDNPETRKMLEKQIDLSFKEPMNSDQRKDIGENYLKELLDGTTSYDDLITKLEQTRVGTGRKDLEVPQNSTELLFGKEESEKIWKADLGNWYQEVFISQEQAYLIRPIEKTEKEKVEMKAEKTFEEVKKDFPDSPNDNKVISDISENFVVKLADLSFGEASDVLEDDDRYYIFTQGEKIDENAVETPYQEISIKKSEENAKEKIDAAKDSLTLKEVKTMEENLKFDMIAITSEWQDTGLGGAQFREAKVTTNEQNEPVVSISFDSEGAKLFESITEKLSIGNNPLCTRQGYDTGEQFAIFVGDNLISAPCVHEKISGGTAQITLGERDFATAQKVANELASNLNTGATPAGIKIVSERKISPELGENSLQQSIYAAIIGFFAIIALMILYYRYFGFLSIIALSFYTLGMIAIIKLFGIVLTLAGIAGIILSIGMAVDANILIFERIREELRSGKNFSVAVSVGFDRAWNSIRDSNVSSLITTAILYGLGTSIIMSFAKTLAIGIVLSMFTAITVTKVLIYIMTPQFLKKSQFFLVGGGRK